MLCSALLKKKEIHFKYNDIDRLKEKNGKEYTMQTMIKKNKKQEWLH